MSLRRIKRNIERRQKLREKSLIVHILFQIFSAAFFILIVLISIAIGLRMFDWVKVNPEVSVKEAKVIAVAWGVISFWILCHVYNLILFLMRVVFGFYDD